MCVNLRPVPALPLPAGRSLGAGPSGLKPSLSFSALVDFQGKYGFFFFFLFCASIRSLNDTSVLCLDTLERNHPCGLRPEMLRDVGSLLVQSLIYPVVRF